MVDYCDHHVGAILTLVMVYIEKVLHLLWIKPRRNYGPSYVRRQLLEITKILCILLEFGTI